MNRLLDSVCMAVEWKLQLQITIMFSVLGFALGSQQHPEALEAGGRVAEKLSIRKGPGGVG